MDQDSSPVLTPEQAAGYLNLPALGVQNPEERIRYLVPFPIRLFNIFSGKDLRHASIGTIWSST